MIWSARHHFFARKVGANATATTPGAAAAAIFDDAFVKRAVFTKYYRKYSLRLARY